MLKNYSKFKKVIKKKTERKKRATIPKNKSTNDKKH